MLTCRSAETLKSNQNPGPLTRLTNLDMKPKDPGDWVSRCDDCSWRDPENS